MKVLWITNIVFPELAKKMHLPQAVGGGWMYAAAKMLLEECLNLELSVATTYPGDKFIQQEIGEIVYFLIPTSGRSTLKYDSKLEKYWKEVEGLFKPDLVHLHGTEFAHGLSFIKACPNVKSVVSIQGLVSVCARYYVAGLSFWDIISNITFRDIVRGSIWNEKKLFVKRGLIEREIIKSVSHIIGRTSWDKAQSLAINPAAKYHFCNETLRDSFYGSYWSYEDCEKHSIFVSQAWYPLKGLHQVIKAMPFILQKFPNTKIYVAGSDVTLPTSFKNRNYRTSYGKYLARLIREYRLEDKIVFTGMLDEVQMRDRYLSSNVFVCSSSIENSSNSLCEAQILGVPCVASYVGGTMDLMKGDEDNLYRFEEVEMLAAKVCEIFQYRRVCNLAMQNSAKLRHDKKANAQQLVEIYQNICLDVFKS